MQENGPALLSIQAAKEAESFYEIPEGGGGKVHRGDVTKAMAAAPHVIKNARWGSAATVLAQVCARIWCQMRQVCRTRLTRIPGNAVPHWGERPVCQGET